MENIELSPDRNWFWIASIVDGTVDAEKGESVPKMPLLDVNAVCRPVTGEYTLLLNQGGLQNRETPKPGKDLFKEKVLPYLMQSLGSCNPITGKLELHLAQGTVKRAILHYN